MSSINCSKSFAPPIFESKAKPSSRTINRHFRNVVSGTSENFSRASSMRVIFDFKYSIASIKQFDHLHPSTVAYTFICDIRSVAKSRKLVIYTIGKSDGWQPKLWDAQIPFLYSNYTVVTVDRFSKDFCDFILAKSNGWKILLTRKSFKWSFI